ncbi:radical SAM protein [Vibrio vulnificus]|uniref:radical SAM protein n=1 Tax=Vibrio vulnificus TaxID=672 RepID=UPI003ED9CC2C
MYELIDLKVGSTCNNKCVHCCAANDERDKNLSLKKIKNRIDEFVKLHQTIDLTLTGGEISMRRDFIEIMQYVEHHKKLGNIREVHLQTNGRKLSDIKKLESTIGVVDYYLIALHGPNSEIHDKITDVCGSFDETVSAFKKLVDRVQVEQIAVQTVISNYNYKHLVETYKFAHEELGITEFNLTFPHPMGDAFDVAITPTYIVVQPYINAAMQYFTSKELKPLPEALPLCIFDREYQKYISDVNSTRFIGAVGYDQDGNLLDYLELSKEAHSKYEKCKICSEVNNCEGVWNEYFDLYPDESSIPAPITQL